MNARIQLYSLIASAVFVTVCLGAQAQATFTTGANVPVGANFYRGVGGVIDTGTDFSRNVGANSSGVETSFEGGNFPISKTFTAEAGGQTESSVRLYSRIYDGSNEAVLNGENLNLQFTAFTASAFDLNEFQARFTFPETVAGDIGFISGFEVVTEGSTPGFESAFFYAFDGAGSILITPNGTFTAVPDTDYILALRLTTTAVPEPATAALCVALVAGSMAAVRRRHRA